MMKIHWLKFSSLWSIIPTGLINVGLGGVHRLLSNRQGICNARWGTSLHSRRLWLSDLKWSSDCFFVGRYFVDGRGLWIAVTTFYQELWQPPWMRQPCIENINEEFPSRVTTPETVMWSQDKFDTNNSNLVSYLYSCLPIPISIPFFIADFSPWWPPSWSWCSSLSSHCNSLRYFHNRKSKKLMECPWWPSTQRWGWRASLQRRSLWKRLSTIPATTSSITSNCRWVLHSWYCSFCTRVVMWCGVGTLHHKLFL